MRKSGKKFEIKKRIIYTQYIYIFYNIFYIINQPYIIIIISCILKPMRVLSYIFVYILPSYLYFVYFFHSIYIYFYLYSSLFIVYFICYIMYIYNIIHVSFFLRTVPGRLAVVCCVCIYCVKIVSAHIPPCPCTYTLRLSMRA